MSDKLDTIEDEKPFHMGRYFAHIIGWSVLLSFTIIGAVFVFIAVRNLIAGETEDGAIWWLLAGIVLIAASAYPLIKYVPDFTMGEPKTPRGNRMRIVIAAVGVLGAVSSLPLILSGASDDNPMVLFSNSALPRDAVLPMMLLWALAIPPLVYFSRRNMDDFARAASDFGMMVGMQLFGYIAPLWWLGWRGGYFPRPDMMLVFIACLVAMNIAVLWKRSNG